ncbi:MAG: TerB family tellurite resistance protein [Pseudomonadota bacterium]
MIRALKTLFESPAQESPESLEHRLHLAAAALLIETARADFRADDNEQVALEALLVSALNLSHTEVTDLIQAARDRADEATSLYEFTRLINDHYDTEQKYRLIQSMWLVAYADGNLDKYEEALIRQVAELTYVPHADYIRAKMAAQNAS